MNGPYYGFPGCPNPSYKEEIVDKQAFLETLFGQKVPIKAHPNPKHYRNKIEFTTTPHALGLKATYNSVLDVEECPILDDELNEVWKKIREFIIDNNVSCYDLSKKEGWLRYVTLRKGVGVQVTLTTTSDEHEHIVNTLFHTLNIASLHWVKNDDKEGVQGETINIFGTEHLVMPLNNKQFFTTPESFFQASSEMMEQALDLMKQHVTTDDTVLDMYCGVGVIGQCLPHKTLTGVELNETAVLLANKNAELNNIKATYFAKDAATYALQNQFDIIIVDPPRTGLGSLAHAIIAAKPKKILYLSCNPKTQRRDLTVLKQHYKVSSITGIDFFPRTEHVECLVTLDYRF